MDYIHSIGIIAVISMVTIALRCLPFLIFNGKRTTPAIITYLGRVLPYAIMGMLVVYCFKSVSIINYPFGLPELIAGVIVVLLHIWKKNALLSIITGTVVYMLLIQLVF